MNKQEIEKIRRLIRENGFYVADKLNDVGENAIHHYEKTNIDMYNVLLLHNRGIDRFLTMQWLMDLIDDVNDYIIITGRDTYNEIAFRLARYYNGEDDVSDAYLKRTITKSNVILLNGGLLPLKDLVVFSCPLISLDNLSADTITRIYVIKSQSIVNDEDGKFALEFTEENKLGLIKDLM